MKSVVAFALALPLTVVFSAPAFAVCEKVAVLKSREMTTQTHALEQLVKITPPKPYLEKFAVTLSNYPETPEVFETFNATFMVSDCSVVSLTRAL